MSTMPPDNPVNYQTLANWLLTGLVGVLSWIYIFIMNRNEKSLEKMEIKLDQMSKMLSEYSQRLTIQETETRHIGEEIKRIREILEG